MRYTEIFKEARRLHDLGFAVHWLHPRSKRPIESGWTSGPRKKWNELSETYIAGLNLGVRLGTPSKIGKGYLAVIDVDIKSKEPHHLKEALGEVKRLISGATLPVVRSGRGNGSRHYYCLTPKPFKTFNPAQSPDIVKVHMPSKKPSKVELKELTAAEIEKGIRLSHAWEISLYSDGRQVVLPPSLHPDSGQLYRWSRFLTKLSDLPLLTFLESLSQDSPPKKEGSKNNPSDFKAAVFQFEVAPVELQWLPLSQEVRDAIVEGKGVTDRSGYLLKASSALLSAGLSQNEVLTVLTDPDTFLGACGYEHAQTQDRARAAHWVYRYTFKKVSEERSGINVFTKGSEVKPARKLTKEEQEAVQADFDSERSWKQDLVRSGNGIPAKLVQNVVLILTNAVHPEVVKRDEFAYRDTYDCDTPWGGKKDAVISDDDVSTIKYWLGSQWGFEPNQTVISDALVVVAKRNSYDPVKDLLDRLPVWDGKERLNSWLSNYFEAKGDSEYLAQVFRKWMVAMILRVYQPGAKFDWMPIFEGAQGIGKSSFGRLLVGDKYFLDWLPNLNDKDSALSLQGMWGVEMGELSQFRRNELENIKAFITRTVDKLRPPYGRRLIESPRRCVFFGTTNRETYLTDETGNRRFKPVVVGNLDFEALARDRVQLFSEAKWIFDQKRETERTLELDGKAKIYERKIHNEKMVEDDSNAMAEGMEIFIEKVEQKTIDFDLEKFRVIDLFEGGGPFLKWKPENRNLVFAAKMLKKMGAQSRMVQGKKYWRVGGLDEKSAPPTHPKNTNEIQELNFF